MRRCHSLGSVVLNGGLFVLLTVACGHSVSAGTSNAGGISSTTGGAGAGGGGGTSSTDCGLDCPIPTGGSGGVGGAGGDDAGTGTSATGGSTAPSTGECSTATTMPNEFPGNTYTPSQEVTGLLQSMTPDQKIMQMYGIPNPNNRNSAVYNDIERSQDVLLGNGKTLRGYKYRDAGRGNNLEAGQIDRTSQGNNYSTAFPVESARAASWDIDMEEKVGEAMGDEVMASKNNLLLAPCMNILRHPYWGRAQETYGEDMYHLGRMASAFTEGLQQHVVGCAKHFAANNIEYNRANQNAVINEQTLREVYAQHFDMVVNQGGVGCIMASYNEINGVKNTQNKHLLTDILKAPKSQGGIGFKGFVMTDWWAMPGDQGSPTPDQGNAQALAKEAVNAGLDLELPWALNYSELGTLLNPPTGAPQISQVQIDDAVGRILGQKDRFHTLYDTDPYGLNGPPTTSLGTGTQSDSIVNNEAHLALAVDSEVHSAVLLTNGTGSTPVLPIPDTVKTIAVVGATMTVTVSTQTTPPKTGKTLNLDRDINIGDRGSSRVNADPDPAKSIGPFAGIQQVAAGHSNITSVTNGNGVEAAKGADFIVVIVGLTAGDEGEEYSLKSQRDRASLDLPVGVVDGAGMAQATFVGKVLDLQKPTAIIIEAGSIVNVPWLSHSNQQQATIWAGYPGQQGGLAFGKLLFGGSNFSGKMPVSWPKELDLPAFRSADDANLSVTMGYYTGYRDYDNRAANGTHVDLVFPFGHGMSYTTFEYSNLQVPCGSISTTGVVNIQADVENTGSYDGDEIVMLFVAPPTPKPAGITGDRPVKELKRFQRVSIAKAGGKRVTLPLSIQDLRHWEGDDKTGHWVVDTGDYTIMVGPDSAHLPLTGKLTVHN